MTGRRMGVEEELFLVDPETRALTTVSDRVIRAYKSRDPDHPLVHELFLQQIETNSEPHADLEDLRQDLAKQRRFAMESAEAAGAAAVAVGSPVLPHGDGQITPKQRYRDMVSEYGALGRNSLVCGTHVHVEVEPDETIAIVDGISPWLPMLLALSANSPYDRGVDTDFASWRAQVWEGWPTAGAVEAFGDAAGYRAAVKALIDSGAAMDEGNIYFDVRVARNYPTVEVRVADACTDLEDTLLVAELSRALVETIARTRPQPADTPWRVEMLRGARWRARRDGLTGKLMDPITRSFVPASEALQSLLAHLHPVLDECGTTEFVEQSVARLLADGTGAERQRAVAQGGSLEDVVDDLVARTWSSCGG